MRQPAERADVEIGVPLVEIRALPQPGRPDLAPVLRRVAADVAAAIGARPEAVWVTWSTIACGYEVAGDVRTEQPPASHPPLVHVAARRSAEQVEAICAAVERALVEELGLDEGNVFVTVRPVLALDPDAA